MRRGAQRGALVCLLAVVPVRALDPSLALSQYATRHWQVEDGLPRNYVTSIVQAADGRLALGTPAGAVYFDGVRFSYVVRDPASPVQRGWVESLAAAPDGSIWISTRDDGLYHCAGDNCRQRDGQAPLNLILDRGGVPVWVGTGGLVRNGTVLVPGVKSSLLSWSGLIETAGGALLAANSGALVRYRDGRAEPASGRDVLSLARGPGDSYWFGTERGLYRGNGERVEGVPGPVVSIVQDRQGLVWAGTWGHGVYRLAGGRLSSVTTRNGLSDDFVHTVFEDSEGNLWIGGRAGLSRWRSRSAAPFGPPEGLGAQYFSAITSGPDGRLWAGTVRSGLHCLGPGTPQRIPMPKPDRETIVSTLSTSADGTTVWASDRLSLWRYQAGKWNVYTGFPNIAVVLADPAGPLWVGTADGLYCLPDGRPGARIPPPLLPRHRIRALLRSRDGAIWAGTLQGLFRNQQAVQGLPDPRISGIAEDTRGRLWVTSRANGLVLIRDGRVRVLNETHGLPPVAIHAVLDDGVASLWLTSSAGLFQIPIEQMDALIAGHRSAVEPIPWNQEDGLRSIEFISGAQPAVCKDAAGDLWFSTLRGLVRIRPRDLRDPAPPRVLITGTRSQGLVHALEFTGVRLGDSRLEFRYRLDGEEWVSLGGSRLLHLNRLSAGTHTVQVSARDAGRHWGPPATWQLIQPPRWYETLWARGLLLLAVAALLYGLYQWRLYLERSRHRAVLTERNRIAQEWHDTLLAGFSAISWQLDTALERLRSKPESAAGTLSVAQKMLGHYKVEARRVIADLWQQQDGPVSLVTALRASIQDITADYTVEASFDVIGDPVPLHGDLAHNVLRICQEATSNAVHHARPTQIAVRLEFGPAGLTASIKDNGAGFDPTRVPVGRFGLAIMKERARRFGGELRVESRPGEGTSVAAAIPLPASHR